MIKRKDENKEFLNKKADISRLLLHVCCAPCLSAALPKLDGLEVVCLFYNPNILPQEEWTKRLDAVTKLVDACRNGEFGDGLRKISLIVPEQDKNDFFAKISGFENFGEHSVRCQKCMDLRLKFTCDYAKKHGFSHFATTLTSSPHKNSDEINKLGFFCDEKAYVVSDFKKQSGSLFSKEVCEKLNLYRQTYCGCNLDLNLQNEQTKTQNIDMNSHFYIGNVKIPGRLVLAPMAGYTDVGFRYVCKKCGAALTFTEMVSCKAMQHETKNTDKLIATTEIEKPKAVQIFGSDVDAMVAATKDQRLQKFDIIDINMGCPMPKIVKNGDGSALMENQDLAEKIIRAVVSSTTKPVTVKFRKGIEFETAVEFAKMCERAGASAITVHGRTRKQLYGGENDFDTIRRVVEAVSIPVIASGDCKSKEQAKEIIERTGATAVMIGRAAVGNPSVFGKEISSKEAIETQAKIDIPVLGERETMLEIRKHIANYFKGEKGASDIRGRLVRVETLEELQDLLKMI